MLLIASLSSAGALTSSAFQEQDTTLQTVIQQQDTAITAAVDDAKKDAGFLKKIWEAIKGLFKKKKVKPVKPNRKIETRSVHFNDLKT